MIRTSILNLPCFLFFSFLVGTELSASDDPGERLPLLRHERGGNVPRAELQNMEAQVLASKKLKILVEELNPDLGLKYDLSQVEVLILKSLVNSNYDVVRQNLTREAIQFIMVNLPQLRELEANACNVFADNFEALNNLTSLQDLALPWALLGRSINRIDLFQLTTLNLFRNDLTDEDLPSVARFSRLTNLNLSGNGISGETLEHIGSITTLVHLDLSYNNLNGNALKGIGTLSNLSTLILLDAFADLGDLSAEQIYSYAEENAILFQCLSQLRVLRFGWGHKFNKNYELVVFGKNCTGLQPLMRLEELDVSRSTVSDEGLETVGQLTSLRTLNLSHSKVQGPGIKFLDSLPLLEELRLNNLEIGERATHLGRLTSLHTLSLCGNLLQDSHISSFRTLVRLTTLDLSNNNIVYGMNNLTTLTRLEHLDLSYNSYSNMGGQKKGQLDGLCLMEDDDLVPICQFVGLRTLRLNSNRFTPACIDHFRSLTNLQLLDLRSDHGPYFATKHQRWKQISTVKNREFNKYGELTRKGAIEVERAKKTPIFPMKDFERLKSVLPKGCEILISYPKEGSKCAIQ